MPVKITNQNHLFEVTEEHTIEFEHDTVDNTLNLMITIDPDEEIELLQLLVNGENVTTDIDIYVYIEMYGETARKCACYDVTILTQTINSIFDGSPLRVGPSERVLIYGQGGDDEDVGVLCKLWWKKVHPDASEQISE
jgi:hypothetical protein